MKIVNNSVLCIIMDVSISRRESIEKNYLEGPIAGSNEGISACDNMSRNCVLSVTSSTIKGEAVVIDKKDSYFRFGGEI